MSTTGHSVGSDAGDRAIQWWAENRRRITIGGSIVFLIGGGAWFTRSARIRQETFAEGELSQARVAAQSGNLQLAASDLGRIINLYPKTGPGQEAVILLANVHLQQSQPELAVSELRDLMLRGPEPYLEGPVAGLLGNALEELGRFAEAADAYDQAAEGVGYDLIRSMYLMEGARAAALAGDTGRAAAAYETIIEEDQDATTVGEATFRLAELRRGSG
ncbi:MAG: tetratricopeptide repeat protein [Gemmatimonadetes bacterium]|nr:tetratricopeptide repeat protein [Gemmatimonadota bacterium]